jgi:hypothetical protein
VASQPGARTIAARLDPRQPFKNVFQNRADILFRVAFDERRCDCAREHGEEADSNEHYNDSDYSTTDRVELDFAVTEVVTVTRAHQMPSQTE